VIIQDQAADVADHDHAHPEVSAARAKKSFSGVLPRALLPVLRKLALNPT
jgi:hypothetical protein